MEDIEKRREKLAAMGVRRWELEKARVEGDEKEEARRAERNWSNRTLAHVL